MKLERKKGKMRFARDYKGKTYIFMYDGTKMKSMQYKGRLDDLEPVELSNQNAPLSE